MLLDVTFRRRRRQKHVMEQAARQRGSGLRRYLSATTPMSSAYVRRRAPNSIADDVVGRDLLGCVALVGARARDPLPWLYGVARPRPTNDLRRERRRGVLTARLA